MIHATSSPCAMRLRFTHLLRGVAVALVATGITTAHAQRLSEVLTPGFDLGVPALRANAVARIAAGENSRRALAHARAAARGLPTRIERPGGVVMELFAFVGDEPLYAITHNLNSAISTGANLLQAAPFSLSGSGLAVGVWDGGSVLASHVEFGGRASVKDGSGADNHATHVAGTIAAGGVNASAKGMVPAATVDSYDWTNDRSEMTSRAATYPGEPGRLYLSNHSYGFIAGWRATGLGSPVYDWFGNGTTSTALEQDFGKYESNARDTDTLAVNAPYFLIFRSAGNDRFDNPAPGQPVALTAGGTSTVSYDPAVHPPGDAAYRNGYDTISFDAVAKNVVTVGAVTDAVSGVQRNPGVAAMTGFSSFGPTDDGRIKPDLVANGDELFSSLAGNNSAYGIYSGTSMATPNATGSAALLVQHFGALFPGQAMRASTLKALLIHTVDDIGTVGPDYQNGWGLMNAKAAADLISSYHAAPGNTRLIESRLTSTTLTRTHGFIWDGTSPIRATLVWTDPAGPITSTSDSRTARLVNNLDLRITGPGGASFSPYVMPYVGTWSTASLTAAATTGKNNTDNVEQVFLAAPTAPGAYSAVVTIDGTLSSGVQNYSLVLSGTATGPSASPALSVVSPASANSNAVVLSVTGSNFLLGATVKLTRSGQPDIVATGVEVFGDLLRCRLGLAGRQSGQWNVVVTNPDGQAVTLANGFTILGALWQENFESGGAGWTTGNSLGSINNWQLTTARSQSAPTSYFAAGPASANINDLTSPPISIPASGTNLSLSFWHSFTLQSGRDGGVLEFSIDGGAWFDVTSSGSGAVFSSGGYNSSFINTGQTNSRNSLAPRACWSGTSSSFTQVVVTLTDTARYAGRTLRARWRLATNSSTSSTGWYIDDVALNGGAAATNLPPLIAAEAAASPNPVATSSTALATLASDDGAESALTYTWASTGGTFLTPVTFSENGTNAAKNTTATFSAAGSYTFTVTIRDAEGLTATSSVDVVVEQSPTTLVVSPASATVAVGSTQLFSAAAQDQFGAPVTTAPSVVWSAAGGGSIAADGTFTASAVGGPFAVSATSGSLIAQASVSVTGKALTTWRTSNFSAEEIASGAAADDGDLDGDGLSNFLEYALGTDPRAGSSIPAPTLDAAGHLTLTLTVPKALPGVRYTGEATSDFVLITPVPVEVLVDADPQTIRLTDPVSRDQEPRRFLWLRATQ